jgi:hypothetical protein
MPGAYSLVTRSMIAKAKASARQIVLRRAVSSAFFLLHRQVLLRWRVVNRTQRAESEW